MHDIQQPFGQGSKDANQVDAKWQEALDKVAAGVVSVKFCHTRSFDGEKAGSSEATGFVADAEEGYVSYFRSSPTRTYFSIDISS
jgi:pro-apoptotic serine protease NMA111